MDFDNGSLPHAELTGTDLPRLAVLLTGLELSRHNGVTNRLIIAVRATMKALCPYTSLADRQTNLIVAAYVLDQLDIIPSHLWDRCVERDNQHQIIMALRAFLPII